MNYIEILNKITKKLFSTEKKIVDVLKQNKKFNVIYMRKFIKGAWISNKFLKYKIRVDPCTIRTYICVKGVEISYRPKLFTYTMIWSKTSMTKYMAVRCIPTVVKNIGDAFLL